MSLLLGEHRRYLADVARLDAYAAALAAVVRPGDRVLDLGSGTGVLAVLACRAGAGHVISVDGSPMAAVARAVIAANGLRDRVEVLPLHSMRLELAEPVDVVVGDQLGAFGLEAGVVEYYADARRRLLRPEGVVVPGRVELVVAPIESTELWDQVGFWDGGADGIDLRPVGPLARNCHYYADTTTEELLGPGQAIADRALGTDEVGPLSGSVTLTVGRPGTLHGIAGWFTATLAPGITVHNGPEAPDRLLRNNVLLPIDRPVAVAPGDQVEVGLVIDPVDLLSRWAVRVTAADGTVRAESRHSTAEGRPMTKEQLRRTHPDHVPTLTEGGRARRTALELFDGEHTVHQIEEAVWHRHPASFPDRTAVAAFVARIVDQEAG